MNKKRKTVAIIIIVLVFLLSIACTINKKDSTSTPTEDTAQDCYTRVYDECVEFTNGDATTCTDLANTTCGD